MKDPYAEVWDEIAKAFQKQTKMISWIAERTLSLKEYREFSDEFAKPKDHDDELEDILKESR